MATKITIVLFAMALAVISARVHSLRVENNRLHRAYAEQADTVHELDQIIENEQLFRETCEQDNELLQRALDHASNELQACSRWYAVRAYDNRDHM